MTKLPGPVKRACFCLYVLLNLFSRFVVGWLVAERESAHLAQALIAESCTRQGIGLGQLSVHSDRGGPMTAKPLALLFADLGVTQSLARPHTPDDNPYQESFGGHLRDECSGQSRCMVSAWLKWNASLAGQCQCPPRRREVPIIGHALLLSHDPCQPSDVSVSTP